MITSLGCFSFLMMFFLLFLPQLGAVAVNLVAGDKPADVYSGIASRYDCGS